ncbi:MAG: hypothetical protein LPD71_04135 [Shewanella sp.]|nr:hypothetical protein [Shewanella sp.]MCF1430250.1 hypothetical protein [Shewanella sp.]MCF1437954.1 hypothetical protein [Shewanella sp.]
MYRAQFTQLTGIQRFITALVAVSMLYVGLLALPVLLAVGAVALLGTMIAGRIALARIRRRYYEDESQTEKTVNWEASRDYEAKGFVERDSFKPRPHIGQTYENGQY